jgi:Ca-activated chloride channel family protein
VEASHWSIPRKEESVMGLLRRFAEAFSAYQQGSKVRFGARLGALFVATAAMGAVVAALSVPSLAKPAPALSSKFEIERTLIPKGDTRTVYVLVHFAAPELDLPAGKRPPLNLTLVLDRSGSMADEGKIDYLRQAAKMAVRSLGERDAISVVEFDDQITTMWPASRAEDTSQLQAMIDELAPRGSTNLAGGLDRGIDESKAAGEKLHLAHDTLDRVILLSDGLANTGITDHGAIARIASDARMSGVRVSSIGLGRDYDEDLMQGIAEAGGGKYYYVESPVQLARIFEEELKTAFATRARDVHLAFHGGSAIRRAELIGFSASSGRDVSADWPDFYAGETRSVLLRLEVDARAEGPIELGHFAVAWHDAESGASGTLDLPIRADVTSDMAASDKSLNRNVSVEAELAESERTMASDVKLYEGGKTDEARKNNATLIQELKTKNATLKDERINRKIEALNVEENQMAAAVAAPAQKEQYLKASKQRLYQAKTGKRSGYVLQPGDKGMEVEQLQRSLAGAGVYKGKITGIYDTPTVEAVKKYQQSKGIDSDGVAGASTQQALGLY